MPRLAVASFCCGGCGLFSLCMIVFFGLTSHSSSAPVYAPMVIAALVVLCALLLAPLALPSAFQPMLRTWATWAPAALGTIAVCTRLAAPRGGPYPLGWAQALSPLAAMLLLRACTVPPVPPVHLGSPDAEGVRWWRLLLLLELPLAGTSLALLYRQLEVERADAMSWWTVAAPLLLLELALLVCGGRALWSTTRPTAPPPSIKDKVEWVRHREWNALDVGCGALLGGMLRVSLLCMLASALDQAAGASEGGGEDVWTGAFFPYSFILFFPLCCCVTCTLCLPDAPIKIPIAPAHAHGNGHGGGREHGGREGAAQTSTRRRPAGEQSGSEGTSPLLGDGGSSGEAEAPPCSQPLSPHLL